MKSTMAWAFLMYICMVTVVAPGPCNNCFNTCLGNRSCDAYGCMAGYYGDDCSKPCPINCPHGVSMTPVCSRVSGTCFSGCKEGFFGERCDSRCSPNCLNSACCHQDGICTQGCRQHWRGLRCMERCGRACANRDCDRNGICKSCKTGFWGLFCENTCSPNCLDNTCIMTEAGRFRCSSGCKLGWKGSDCGTLYDDDYSSGDKSFFRKRRLSRASIGNCYSEMDGKCNCCKSGFTGDNCSTPCPNCRSQHKEQICILSCKVGFHGTGTQLCNLNCSGSCLSQICERSGGKCTGCEEGYFGKHCETECSKQCVGRCLQYNGVCLNCSNTKHGNFCEEACSSSCKDKICDRWNGTCTRGCIPGAYGPKCEGNCSDTCKGGRCVLTMYGYPVCTDECVDGYRGRYCEERYPLDCVRCSKFGEASSGCSDAPDVKLIIIIILSIALVSCVVLLTICIKHKRCLKGQCPFPCCQQNSHSSLSMRFSNIRESDVQTQTTGQDSISGGDTSPRMASDQDGNPEHQNLLRENTVQLELREENHTSHQADSSTDIRGSDTNRDMQINARRTRNGVRPDSGVYLDYPRSEFDVDTRQNLKNHHYENSYCETSTG